jgi:hypothetical protein
MTEPEEKLAASIAATDAKVNAMFSLFDALPIMGHLHLRDNDTKELALFKSQCESALTASGQIGKVNWCNIVAALNATIAALVAAGVPVPPYMEIIVSILSSLCPNPPAPSAE